MTKSEYDTNRPRKECPNCGKSFTAACFNRHYTACINPNSKLNNTKTTEVYVLDHDDLACKFCKREFKSKNALTQHEIRCKENLNRKNFDALLPYIVTKRKGQTKATCDEIYRQSQKLKQMYKDGDIVPYTKGKPGTFLGKHHTKEQIDAMMASYKRTKDANGYTYKFGIYQGIKCDSGWELAFVLYCIDHDLPVVRCTESFEYQHPTENRTAYYFPDFMINDTYYEVKGIVDDVVLAKCAAFPKDKTLILLDEPNIKHILQYCKETYGKDYASLYDRNYPSWMDCVPSTTNNDISNP